jgi:alanine racemase
VRNTALARIDTSALRHNVGVVRRLCPSSRIMAMVKADAYGHGLVAVARALREVDGMAVARLQEALTLREAGIRQRLLLLSTVLGADDLALCSALQIDVTAHDPESVAAIEAASRVNPLRVWLKLDSGMHRMGLDAPGFIAADRVLSIATGVVELTHMTHFSDADSPGCSTMDRQVECFRAVHAGNAAAQASLANSAAILTRPEVHADWVRPGIMLYGGRPLSNPPAHATSLRTAMTLTARVVTVREVGTGEQVGYARQWTAARPSRIAAVGIGYADGYPRHAPNGTPVWINGAIAPLAGRVSMDTITIDVTDLPAVGVGDEVVLWGPPLAAAAVAAHAGTIDYELLAGLGPRVDRAYN